MAALEALLAGILARWAIPPERVVGHACVAPGRKIDPGEKLDWRRLARRGLAVWLDMPAGRGAAACGGSGDSAGLGGPTRLALTGLGPTGLGPTGELAGHPTAEDRPDDAARFRVAAHAFGYALDDGEGWTPALRAVWRSFAMRFRPHEARSEPHEAGIRHLEALAVRWPVAPDPSPRSPT
jgi:N-acetyl-anhydromuramyl-L-alanine amidase AmpD